MCVKGISNRRHYKRGFTKKGLYDDCRRALERPVGGLQENCRWVVEEVARRL